MICPFRWDSQDYEVKPCLSQALWLWTYLTHEAVTCRSNVSIIRRHFQWLMQLTQRCYLAVNINPCSNDSICNDENTFYTAGTSWVSIKPFISVFKYSFPWGAEVGRWCQSRRLGVQSIFQFILNVFNGVFRSRLFACLYELLFVLKGIVML